LTQRLFASCEFVLNGQQRTLGVEHIQEIHQAARALLGKGRNAGEGAAGLSKSSAKKSARKSAMKNHAAMR
jgi:hypothetical protein